MGLAAFALFHVALSLVGIVTGLVVLFALFSVSLVVLTVTIPALYVFHLAGPWRQTYVSGGVTALYLNVLVLIAKFFVKIPALKTLAPTQSQPLFLAGGVHVGFHSPWVSRG